MSRPSHDRRPILAGNWKMNLLRREANAFCTALSAELAERNPDVDVVIFPPAILIDTVVEGCRDARGIEVGGQDVHEKASGAHTGDISAAQLHDAACRWALVGHSERRRDHGEDDALVGRKARAAFDQGLWPMICLGETDEERRAGATFEVLERQLEAALAELPAECELAIAYEPVWAIGTGLTATPELAQEAHAHLRRLLGEKLGEERAGQIRLLYGGSAKPSNVEELFAEPDVDGFLVGGASLDSVSFSAMISACAGS